MNNLIDKISKVCYEEANSIIKGISGIVNCFSSEEDKAEFIALWGGDFSQVCEDRASYGDWQTPLSLAEKVCDRHIFKFGNPDVVIEPTCGLGAFVFAALKKFSDVSEIHALEINREYTKELKLKLLINAMNYPRRKNPDIYIYNADFFKFDFTPIIQKSKTSNRKLAVIGNPPWVTNSSQGRNNSTNLPPKRNSYGLRGIDAITGRSNFDISENITMQLLRLSQSNRGGISFLLKNSVIRNILQRQHTAKIHIGDIEQGLIDSHSEFNVSVDASCFSAWFDCIPSMVCSLKDFYTDSFIRNYGWVNNLFVSDTESYANFSKYDKHSDYVWRSGIKHDCASVLELTVDDGQYINGFGEVVQIEDDLIYPLLKSSDIKSWRENKLRKYIIVPQRKVGQDTSALRYTHPSTYAYLCRHEADFLHRRSSIYKGKDKFSIFGVGDYSFKPYKILISSLYKSINFILVTQFCGKPIMADDTCYQLGFDNYEEAKCIYDALNSNEIQSLLRSLIFKDAKRVVTKSLLMRLDLVQFCKDNEVIIPTQRSDCHYGRQLSLFD